MAGPRTKEHFDQALTELEGRIRALQVRFEQYFLGIERSPPTRERDEIRSALLGFQASAQRNTALKFRVSSLWQRFLTYDRMWSRTLKEMEEGRYHRDVYKARLRARPADSGTPASSAPGRKAPEGLTDTRVQQLYEAYVQARARTGEDSSKVSLDGLRRTLDRQLPQLRERHGGRDMDFKVVIRNGKAVLKAVPK